MNNTGDEYYDSDEFRELLAEYENAVSSGQPVFLDAEELTDIADYYQMTGYPDEANDAINLALSLSPGAVAPLTYKIHEALYNENFSEAEQLLGQIIDKNSPDYTYCRGEILIAKGEIDEADNYFREAFKNVPPDEYQDYVVDIATIFTDYNYSEKAMEWMARGHHEDSSDFKELMARTLFGLGKYKDSQKIFNELIDRDPFSTRYWNALASAQYMNEEYDASVTSSEYAIAIDPNNPEGLLSKANGLFRLENYEEAEKYFERYNEQIPDDAYALLQQATCLINLERPSEAVELLNTAYDLLPADSPYLPDVLQELAFAYSDQGETDRAIDCLNQTDNQDCDHTHIAVVKGHILLNAGRIEESEEVFRQAIVQSENPQQTLLRVIVSLYDNRYLEAAYKLFLRFFSIAPKGWNEGYAYMALCCYDMKKYDEFLNYLKQACRLNPKEARLVLHHLFPKDVKPEDYYTYIKNKLKK